ncbi:MAG: DUF2752 domain-containing protein [Marmoricola sp.]
MGGTLAVHLRDPHRPGSWGRCPVKLLTGWDCPGCGALRAVEDLTRGDLAAAWHSNPLLVLSLPLLALAWLSWMRRARHGRPWQVTPRMLTAVSAAYVVVMLVFAVYRNTAWGAAFHVS